MEEKASAAPSHTKHPHERKSFFLFSLIFLFLLISVSLYLIIRINEEPPAPASVEIPIAAGKKELITHTKPMYTPDEKVIFAHYHLGYTITYPANEHIKLVGASDGNFAQKNPDGSSLLIYNLETRSTITPLTVTNLEEQLLECNEGGCLKFFANRTNETTKEKKVVRLNSNNAFWIKSITLDNETIERYIIALSNSFLIIEIRYLHSLPSDIVKQLESFSLIPQISDDWATFRATDISKISFKYPNEYEPFEDPKLQQLELLSNNDAIKIYYYDPSHPIYKYQSEKSELNLETAYFAEKLLGNNITKQKFSLNAFTFTQGGNPAIRVVDPVKKQMSVYFHTFESPFIYRITGNEKSETTMNQILRSVNNYMPAK